MTVQDEKVTTYGSSSKRTGGRLARLLMLIAGIAALALLGVGMANFLDNRSQPELVKQLESAGFKEVDYTDASEVDGTVASATALYGSCQLRFISTTQQLADGTVVARTALVRDDGSIVYDPTAFKLSLIDAFAPCTDTTT